MDRLRVGIDVTMAGIADGERTGVFQYQRHLVRALSDAEDVDLTLFFALPRMRHVATIDQFVRDVTGRRPVRLVRGWMPLRLLRNVPVPVEVFTGALDLLHAPAHLLMPSLAPGVVTIHDLAYLNDRGAGVSTVGLDGAERQALRLRKRFFCEVARQTGTTVRRAAHVITVSEATRAGLLREFALPPDRVSVIPLGLRTEAVAVQTPAQLAHWRTQLKLPECFVLYVGNVDPNKNLTTLFEGFAHFCNRGGRALLCLAGRSLFYQRHLEQLAHTLGLGEVVRFLGRVDDAALPALYRLATAVVMPSRLEGFGLPAIEAMACGVPVVVADAGALPEVVGGAALRVAPEDAHGFGEALLRIEQDAALAAHLRKLGFERSRHFDWQHMARDTLAVYRRVAAHTKRGA